MSTKRFFRKLLSVMLLAAMMIPAFGAAASAAADWPSLSESAYCEFTASSDIKVYKNSDCTTRGTANPSKAYNAYISKNDVCRIVRLNSSYAMVQYPTSSGYRTGYIKRSALLNVSNPTDRVTSQGKATTYKSASGSSYGSVAQGDQVYLCGSSSGRTAVIYEARSGSRAYKLGYVANSDLQSRIIGSVTPPSGGGSDSWDSLVGQTVASIKSGSSYTLHYNSKGNISAAGGYTGQCTWYCYGRFYEVNGIKLATARHAKYWLSENENDSRVRVQYGESAISPKSIAVRTSGTWGHVMFIEHVTYKNGSPAYVYFTECNSDGNGQYNAGRDCILQRMTYSEFVRQKKPAGYISAR